MCTPLFHSYYPNIGKKKQKNKKTKKHVYCFLLLSGELCKAKVKTHWVTPSWLAGWWVYEQGLQSHTDWLGWLNWTKGYSHSRLWKKVDNSVSYIMEESIPWEVVSTYVKQYNRQRKKRRGGSLSPGVCLLSFIRKIGFLHKDRRSIQYPSVEITAHYHLRRSDPNNVQKKVILCRQARKATETPKKNTHTKKQNKTKTKQNKQKRRPQIPFCIIPLCPLY